MSATPIIIDPVAPNCSLVRTSPILSEPPGSVLTWFDLKRLWRTQKPGALVKVITDPLTPISLPDGGTAYPYPHKQCLHFAQVAGGSVVKTVSRFNPETVSATALTALLTTLVTGVSFYAIQFYGIRSPKTVVTPPAKRPFTSSLLNFAIYPITM